MWTNGDSGQARRAASSRFSVPSGVGIEIDEGNSRRAIVRRLRRGMDDRRRLQLGDERQNALAVTYVDFMVPVIGNGFAQQLQRPARVALRAEEISRAGCCPDRQSGIPAR